MKYKFLGLLLFAVIMFAQDSSTMTAEIIINADHGWPTRISINGECNNENAWLGISLYPYNTVDAVTGGRHSNSVINKGHFSQEIQVDKDLLGGSFEVALWGNKIDKIDCTLEYCHWCKLNGYHFDDLLVYKTGLLNNIEGY
ncbi:MAG: hypothetical protein ISR90_00140 [Candidatus Marinimicrobia bacterium]|nr:hypothetical protein [Candidatus Neomarinimicrobiota bacterium]MBL7022450.1 hypothetical protein [Candidatus Neomarinimicrobiota bacterium]MBL7108695.1 hypothetical protein [Candidatus Neomarinimicrobiota bacterium]